jgi:hypothetical protein
MSALKPVRSRTHEIRGATRETREKLKRSIFPDVPTPPTLRMQQTPYSSLLLIEKGEKRTNHLLLQSRSQPRRNARRFQQYGPQEKEAMTSFDLMNDEVDSTRERARPMPMPRKPPVSVKTTYQLMVLDQRAPTASSTGSSFERAERRYLRL